MSDSINASQKYPVCEVGEEAAGSSAVYENTNGVPLCNGKNLHMDVRDKVVYNLNLHL